MNVQLKDIETPAAIIDVARMSRNIERMQRRINELGAAFRPHVKTSKCVEIASRQRAAGARGITVSTLKEADEFFAAGFKDILYAVCIAPNKVRHALALRQRGCALQILVDSVAAANAVVKVGRETKHVFDVLIEIDTDGHRSGIAPNAASLLEVGQVLHRGGANVLGVMTHAGSSYDHNTPAALQAIAEQERAGTVAAAQRLRDAGLPCPVVSVGSTPTALSATQLNGVTEVRAGVYVFFDLVMAGTGVCKPDDIALSVLTSVIGHQAEKGWVIVDAGWMAMSRDRGTQKQTIDYGYGAVCDANRALLNDYIMSGANQEHGIISRRDGIVDPQLIEKFPVGTNLRILPNHACATAAQFPEYVALHDDGRTETWPRFHGW
jgi:D-serine deaminase-like pyridoxal phosphate-dependent protein